MGAAEEKILNIYNWADYIGENTISEFEAETGIHVNYDVYEATTSAEAKLLAGDTGYDLVLHSIRYAIRLFEVGVFQPLDKDKLPLWDNLDPWVLDQMADFDPGNSYGAPYMWGTTGYSWNVDMVRERWPDAPVDSARMLFDPAVVSRFADCGVTLLDDPTDVIPMAMQYNGHDIDSIEPADLEQAEETLGAVRPYIRYFSSGKMINDLPNREVCVAMSWSGDFLQAEARAREVGRDINLAYTVPKEGTTLWFDALLIPSDAPHPGNAHLFLNFLMRPKVIADISNLVGYANGNQASMPYLDARIRDNPAAYPPMSDREGWRIGRIMGPKEERVRTRIWARVKAGL